MRRALAALALALTSCVTPIHDGERQNAAIVRSCSDAVNRRDIDTYIGCWAPHARNNGFDVRVERVREIMSDILQTFPDYRSEIIMIVAQGDMVVTQSIQSGTHRGMARTNFNGGGLQGVAPTDRRMEIRTTHWWRLENGKIVEHQAIRDDLTMMRQLGLAPSAN